jgi:capsular exopolysaccharide synthesis family protein
MGNMGGKFITKGGPDMPPLPVVVSQRDDYAEKSSSSGLFWILRRRLALILLTIAVIVGGAAVWLATTTPVYRASAMMQLDETVTVKEQKTPQQAAPPVREIEQQLDYTIRVQIESLKSHAVARRVVADLKLYDEPEFNPKGYKPLPAPKVPPAPVPAAGEAGVEGSKSVVLPAPDPLATVPQAVVENTIDALHKRVNAEQAGTSDFIRVTAESTDPEMAMKIANSVVRSYVVTRTQELTVNNKRLIGDLSKRTEELNQRLKDAEYKVADFKRRLGMDAGFAAAASAAQIAGAASEVASARGASAEAAAIAARQRSAGAASSGLLTSLRNQESILQSRLANLSTQFGPRHPDVMSASAELGEIQAAIAVEASRASAIVQSTSDGASARAGQIASELGGLRARARSEDMASPELTSLEREVETSKSLYLLMSERLKDLQTRADNPTPEALPVSAAILPLSPSFPKPFQIMSVALISSVILGIFFALIADSFDNRLRSGEQIGRLTSLPTFAMIPQRGSVPNRLTSPDAPENAPKSIFAEAFRGGFLEIMARTSSANSRIILITSALPGEGKTTVSLGIAMSALAQGMRAIALDFDFRRRGMTKALGLGDISAGLDTYLAGETSLDDSISYAEKGGGIATMPVSAVPDDPSALFDQDKLDALFSELRSKFDFIVIDTPPTMAVRDAKVLANYSDASVMTARWGTSTPDTVRSVTRLLGDELIGVIITRVDYAKHARFGFGDSVQYYSRYSSYYNDGDIVPQNFFKRWLSRFRQKFSAA